MDADTQASWAAALWLGNSNPDDRELGVPPSTQRTLCFSLSVRQLPKFNSFTHSGCRVIARSVIKSPDSTCSSCQGWTHMCSHTVLLGGSERLGISVRDASLLDVTDQQESGDQVLALVLRVSANTLVFLYTGWLPAGQVCPRIWPCPFWSLSKPVACSGNGQYPTRTPSVRLPVHPKARLLWGSGTPLRFDLYCALHP